MVFDFFSWLKVRLHFIVLGAFLFFVSACSFTQGILLPFSGETPSPVVQEEPASAKIAQAVIVATVTPSTKKTDEPLRWTTYYDSLYGYSIQFPVGWYVQAPPEKGGMTQITSYDLASVSGQQVSSPVAPDQIKISIGLLKGIKPTKQTISDWAKSQLEGSTLISQINVTVDSVAGVKQISSRGDDLTVTIYLDRGQDVFFISAFPGKSVHMNKFDGMVPTLKFTK